MLFLALKSLLSLRSEFDLFYNPQEQFGVVMNLQQAENHLFILTDHRPVSGPCWNVLHPHGIVTCYV